MAGISDPSLPSIRRLRGAASPNTADIDWNEFCAFTVTSSWLKVVPKSESHFNPLLSGLPQTGTIEVWPSIEAICPDLDNQLQMFMRYVDSQYGGEARRAPVVKNKGRMQTGHRERGLSFEAAACCFVFSVSKL